jgi:hypothetical protein
MSDTTATPVEQQRLVGPWENPDETTPIPKRTIKWTATAAAQLCEALSCRSDTPSEFARHVRNAYLALQEATNALREDWPNESSSIL